jgi:hypothetical protein
MVRSTSNASGFFAVSFTATVVVVDAYSPPERAFPSKTQATTSFAPDVSST